MDYQTFIFMLIFAHFMADYVFQTTWIWANKKTKIWSMLVHCSIYTGCTGFILIEWLNYLNWGAIGAIFISHWLIDSFKIALAKKRCNSYTRFIRSEDDWFPTFVDQLLHFCILLIIIIAYR